MPASPAIDPVARLIEKGRLTEPQRAAALQVQTVVQVLKRSGGLAGAERQRLADWFRDIRAHIVESQDPLAWPVFEQVVVRGNAVRSAALGGMRQEKVERLVRCALDVVAADLPPA